MTCELLSSLDINFYMKPLDLLKQVNLYMKPLGLLKQNLLVLFIGWFSTETFVLYWYWINIKIVYSEIRAVQIL